MERRLVIIRHAKATQGGFLERDFDRALNSRGQSDSPVMGERLKKQQLIPDLIIASAAKRTMQTAKNIAGAVGYSEQAIKSVEKLYHCSAATFEEVIVEIDDAVKTVFIVGHNPGITEFVNSLSGTFKIDNMPTCGVVAATIDTTWSQFYTARKNVYLFEYPKKES